MALRRVLPSRVQAETPPGDSASLVVPPQAPSSSAAPSSVSDSLSADAPSSPPVVSAPSTGAAAMVLLDEPVLPPLDTPSVTAPEIAPASLPAEPLSSSEAKSFRAPTPVIVASATVEAEAPEILPPASSLPAVSPAEPASQTPDNAPKAPSVFGEASAEIPAAPLQPLPEPSVAAESTPPAQPSLPGDTGGNLRRKMQPRKPRSFDLPAAPAEPVAAPSVSVEPSSPEKPKEEPSSVAPSSTNSRGVPINTTPLDLVDDKLAEAGVIAPETDPLTSRAPVGLAEADTPLGEMEEPLSSLPPLDIPPLSAPAVDVPLSEATPSGLAVPLSPPLPPSVPPAAVSPDLTVLPDAPLPSRRAPTVAPDFSLSSSSSASKPVSSAPLPDLPPVASDLPWSNTPAGDGWDFAQSAPEEPSSPMPYAPDNGPADIFKNVPSSTIAGLPFSTQPAGGTALPPPEITGQHPRSTHGGGKGGGSSLYMILGAGAVAAVIMGAYWLVSHNGVTDASQWAQNLASKPTAVSPSVVGNVSNSLGLSGTALMPPPVMAGIPGQPISSSAQIAFADVPPDQANQPIVADGTEKMPQDISLVAKLQQAVADRKAQEQAGVSPTLTTDTAGKAADSAQLKAQLDKELAAYRKALAEASGVSNVPPPGKFLSSTAGAPSTDSSSSSPAKTDSEGAPLASVTPSPMGTSSDSSDNSALLPPPSAASLPPASLYANNPNSLPVVAEPSTNEPAKVRTLEDFNVAMFEPKEDKVRIPKGVKPKISTTDFPQMELLSLVPGKGIIAYYQGREGVLLLGETIDGWELSMVKADVAEFKNGDKTHFISSNE